MIQAISIKCRGKIHQLSGCACQDAYFTSNADPQTTIAAVADGIGGEKHSDIAAEVAVRTAVRTCIRDIMDPFCTKGMTEILRHSFCAAKEAIYKEAANAAQSIYEYGTTLTLAVVSGGEIYYGNAGDSSIILLDTEGKGSMLTHRQRDRWGAVYPLDHDEKRWEFGQAEGFGRLLVLATDGAVDAMFSPGKKERELCVLPACRELFQKAAAVRDEKRTHKLKKTVEQYLNSADNITGDDKTVVILKAGHTAPERNGNESTLNRSQCASAGRDPAEPSECGYSGTSDPDPPDR